MHVCRFFALGRLKRKYYPRDGGKRVRDGISGQPLPNGFPYKTEIEQLCDTPTPETFFPCLVGAIKMNETGLGQGPATEWDISGDGGHGIMQLTSSFPDDWEEPAGNIGYAIRHFLMPAYEYWKQTLQGGDLIRAIAATYNGGLGNAQAGHDEGDIDKFTTNRYGERALAHYINLAGGTIA